MNTPREPEEQGDKLLAAYRRASASDASGPSPWVRDTVLAQVHRQQAPAAANDDHRRWKAVAGIAVVGIGALLASHGFRLAPLKTELVASAPAPAQTRATNPMVAENPDAASASATGQLESRLIAGEQAAGKTLDRAQHSAPAEQDFNVAPPAVTGLDTPLPAAPASARSAARQRALTAALRREMSNGGHSLQAVRRAVTERFANLFLPVGDDQVNLLVVLLTESGEIERTTIARVSASDHTTGETFAAARFKALGTTPDQLLSPGFTRLVKEHTAPGTPDLLLLVQYAWLR